MKQWTEKEKEILRQTYHIDGGVVPGRSPRSIETMAYRLGLVPIHPGSRWSDNEIDVLKEYYAIEGGKTAERLPGRSSRAVHRQANKIGLKSDPSRGSRVIDETGNRYGKLIVLGRAESPSGYSSAFWLCRCDCGNLKAVPGYRLRQHGVTSCGCQRYHYPESLMKKYMCNAARRGNEWLLSLEQFQAIIEQDCYYCGAPPAQIGGHVRNGIDRVDNGEGYTISNVVPCCSRCNQMKSDLDVVQFLEQCCRIAAFRRG